MLQFYAPLKAEGLHFDHIFIFNTTVGTTADGKD